jgi:hypothetical protein
VAGLVSCGPEKHRLPIPGTKLASTLYVGYQHMWGLSPGQSRVTISQGTIATEGCRGDWSPADLNSLGSNPWPGGDFTLTTLMDGRGC